MTQIIATRNTTAFSGGHLSTFVPTPDLRLKKLEDQKAFANWCKRNNLSPDEDALEQFCAKGRWILH
ncbi:MAG: hypothetical protein V1851_02765 [Patescibacteria group bacterium]